MKAKLKKLFRNPFRNRKPVKGKAEIPKEWEVKKNGKPLITMRVIHVPFLKTLNRTIAFIMLLINFGISQATLLSNPTTQPLFWFFIFNTYICFRYLWITRGE